VLNFLAAHPTEAFTLSDIAGRLGINPASAHALLTVLTEGGYLSRNARLRTFALGPAVIALGTAALDAHPVIDVARDAARGLATETGLEVALTAPAGEHIIFLGHAGEPSPRGVPVHVGQRVPLVPPIGSVFVAWGEAEAWLARADDPERLQRVLDVVRRRGYSVALEAEARQQLGHALDGLAAEPSNDELKSKVNRLVSALGEREYQLQRVNAQRRYDVSMIAAPIFGSTAQVVLVMTLLGFDGGLLGSEIAELGERLRDVALVVTKQTRGRIPA
jgi:DNA-binding IclR family transcriptional regulator